jgi:hypothetical protein
MERVRQRFSQALLKIVATGTSTMPRLNRAAKHIGLTMCAVLVVTECLETAQAAPVPLERFLDSTWKVLTAGDEFGTAFLIRNDGYFITAAHVAIKSTSANGVVYHNLRLQAESGPLTIPIAATVEKNWCQELDTTLKVCRKGADAVLLKTQAVPAHYLPFDIGFSATTPTIFQAVFAGYAARQVGASLYESDYFQVKDLKNHLEYQAYFAPGSTVYYQTVTESFPGNSGGPIATKVAERGFEVVGIMSWRKPGFADVDRAGPSFGTTIDVMRNIWAAVPRTPETRQLANQIQTGEIDGPQLSASLNKMSNTGVVSLLSELRERESQQGQGFAVTGPQWTALYDAATVRELDQEKLYIEPKIDVSQNISWLRDSAKSRRRLGEQAALTGDDAAARKYFIEAVSTNERFLVAARESQREWFGPNVFNDVISEMGTLHTSLGDRQRVADWAALGVQTGSPNATETLAKQAFAKKDFKTSADLYALAYQQARKSGRTTPGYIIDGYEKSVIAAPEMSFPKNIESAPAQDPQSLELDKLGPGWKQLAREYGPSFATE